MSLSVKYSERPKRRRSKTEVVKEIGEYERSVMELVDAAKRYQRLDQWENKLPAVISHWLLSGAETTRILGAEFHSIWKEFTKSYGMNGHSSVLKDGVQISLPLGITLGEIPFPPPPKPSFTFIDLFAGIGGFRIALQKHAGKCVFTSEWDKAAQQTYFTNFGEYPFGDIRDFTADSISDSQLKKLIPDHDILAGFQLN